MGCDSVPLGLSHRCPIADVTYQDRGGTSRLPILCPAMPTSLVARATGDAAASGAGGHVGGEDVVGVAVEVLAVPVMAERMVVRGSACWAAIWTSFRSTPASKLVVTNVCLSMWGCGRVIRTPACRAMWRRR